MFEHISHAKCPQNALRSAQSLQDHRKRLRGNHTPRGLKRFCTLCVGLRCLAACRVIRRRPAWERYTVKVDRIREALDILGGNDEENASGPVVVSRHRCGRLLQDEQRERSVLRRRREVLLPVDIPAYYLEQLMADGLLVGMTSGRLVSSKTLSMGFRTVSG